MKFEWGLLHPDQASFGVICYQLVSTCNS